MKDNLVECGRCGGNACYETQLTPEIKNYYCFGCGFQSCSAMKLGYKFFNEQMQLLPELYKELAQEDENGLIWFPSTVNIPETGMVFANGVNGKNWKWAAVKAVEVLEEEKEKFKGQRFKMDMSSMVEFEEKDYMEALSHIGILPK